MQLDYDADARALEKLRALERQEYLDRVALAVLPTLVAMMLPETTAYDIAEAVWERRAKCFG